MKNNFRSRFGAARVSRQTSMALRGIFRMAYLTVILSFCLGLFSNYSFGQTLKLNNLGYFETQGVNVLVYSNQYTGVFYDEKTAGIEIIHHGVRTSTGGAVRLQNTPEPVSYTHLRAHETDSYLVCRLLLEKKKKKH